MENERVGRCSEKLGEGRATARVTEREREREGETEWENGAARLTPLLSQQPFWSQAYQAYRRKTIKKKKIH